MMPCACACFMVQRRQQIFVLLIMVLLLRYSAAGWPVLWPLQPYLDFGATGAPTFNLGRFGKIGVFHFFTLIFTLSQTTAVVGAAL